MSERTLSDPKLCERCGQPMTNRIHANFNRFKVCDACNQPHATRWINDVSSEVLNLCDACQQSYVNWNTQLRETGNRPKSLPMKLRNRRMLNNQPYPKFLDGLSRPRLQNVCSSCQARNAGAMLHQTPQSPDQNLDYITASANSTQIKNSCQTEAIESFGMKTSSEITAENYIQTNVCNPQESPNAVISTEKQQPNSDIMTSLRDIISTSSKYTMQNLLEQIQPSPSDKTESRVSMTGHTDSEDGSLTTKNPINTLISKTIAMDSKEKTGLDEVISRGSLELGVDTNKELNPVEAVFELNESEINVRDCNNNVIQTISARNSPVTSPTSNESEIQQTNPLSSTIDPLQRGDVAHEVQKSETGAESSLENEANSFPVQKPSCPQRFPKHVPSSEFVFDLYPSPSSPASSSSKKSSEKNVGSPPIKQQPKPTFEQISVENEDRELQIRKERLLTFKNSRNLFCLSSQRHHDLNIKQFCETSTAHNFDRTTNIITSSDGTNHDDQEPYLPVDDQHPLDTETTNSAQEGQHNDSDTVAEEYNEVRSSLDKEEDDWISYLEMISQYEPEVIFGFPPAEPIPSTNMARFDAGLNYDHSSHVASSSRSSSTHSTSLEARRRYFCPYCPGKNQFNYTIRSQIQDFVTRIFQCDSIPPINLNDASDPISRSVDSLANSITNYYDLVRPGPSNASNTARTISGLEKNGDHEDGSNILTTKTSKNYNNSDPKK